MSKKRDLVNWFDDAKDAEEAAEPSIPADPKDLEIFATIPWRLAPNQEMMTVSERQLNPAQVEALLRLLKSSDMMAVRATDHFMGSFNKEPTYTSHAIPEPSKYSTIGQRNFDFNPPVAYAPVWRSAWDKALPSAEARVTAIFERLAELPWKRSQTADARYYLVAEEMTEEQIKLADAASDNEFIKKSSFSILHNGNYELENDGRGYTDHRFYQYIHQAMEAAYDEDAAAVGELPWVLTQEGDLVVYQSEIANLLTDGAKGEALSRAMTRRNIENKEGFFILRSVNTVGKLYERPDGEVDHGRIYCFDAAMKGVTERLQKTIDQMLDLPWVHNPVKLRFEINPNIITSGGFDPVRDLPENALLREGSTFFLPELPLISRPTGEIQKMIYEFMDKLAHKFSDTDLMGAEVLPWKNDRIMGEGLQVTAEEMKKAGIKKLSIPHKISSEGNFYIPNSQNKRLAYMPYNASISATVQRNHSAFLEKNAEEINALPWVAGIADNTTDIYAIRLFKGELDPVQLDLVKEMVSLGMLEDSKTELTPESAAVLKFLQPAFEKAREKMISDIAAMPWVYVQSGISFQVKAEELTTDQLKLVERARWRFEQYGGNFILKASQASANYFGKGFETYNRLVQAVAHERTRNALVPKLPNNILSLPWRHESRFIDKRLTVDERDLTASDQAALVAAGFHKCLSSYDVRGNNSTYLALAILDAAAYAQLATVADANMRADLKMAEGFPWGDMSNGQRGVRLSDLTAEQQIVLKCLPHDYWDRTRVGKFSRDEIYAPNKDVPDQRLVMSAMQGRTASALMPETPAP